MNRDERLALRLVFAQMSTMDKFEIMDMLWAQLAYEFPEMADMYTELERLGPIVLSATAHERDKRRRYRQHHTSGEVDN